MMAPTKMKLRVRKKEKGSAKPSQQQQQPLRPETSPDSKCPICLDRFVNVASVERCLHRFCFRCIREWAKNKAECPLCKQPFRSIFHSVRAENDFKEFVVLEENAQSATTSASAAVTLAAAAIAAAPAGQNDAESTAIQTRRSRATRSRQRRSQRAQDSAPSASSVEGVPLDHLALMQRDPACLRQLLPWLRRERVMGTNPSELRPFLLARTDHILHELVSFARSIEAMQCPPAPSYEEDSGSQSSIINISEDDDESVEAEVTEDNAQDGVPPVSVATSSEISLSQSAWDDETPGPSYSTISHPQTKDVELEESPSGGTSAATELREHHEDDHDEEEECMIVGYVKPMAERTPELVQLSSDSTVEEDEEGEGKEASAAEAVTKAETSLPSREQAPLSPKPCPSTSHTERGENLEQSVEKDPGKLLRHRRKEHAPRRGFGKPSHSPSGSRSQTSSESSPQSGHSVKIGRSQIRLNCREPRRSHQVLGRSPTVSSSEELLPAHSITARDKPPKCFSPWDSPGHDSERRKKRRKRRRERETERSRSPHREPRQRHGDRELWLRSSSSDADSLREKPAGKRKYKTRHLERTAWRRSGGKTRERKRERERSPSVEIIFERRASNTHSKARRRKKRSRRRDREQNSPTVITINSDSSSDHTGHTCRTEPDSRTADLQNRLTDDDRDSIDNDHAAAYRDHAAADNERFSDCSDHTIDYQERLEVSDRPADDKDRLTDSRNGTASHQISAYQNCRTGFSDSMARYRDGVTGAIGQSPESRTNAVEVGAYPTDKAAEHQAHAAGHSHSAGHALDCKRDGTTDLQQALLDPDDFQNSVTDIRNRAEPRARVLDTLNLEHCLVDVVQPIRRVAEDHRRAATSLSDARLLELEGDLLGEEREALRNSAVGQQEAGLVAHRDQSESEPESEPTAAMRVSRISSEMSPDV